jgi:tetratricopeptide (TPR) repeat protein
MTQVTVQQAIDIAWKHHEAGRYNEAEPIYRQILAQDPNHAQAVYGLGLIALHVRHPDSINWLRRAAALQPGFAAVHNNLGNALQTQGKLEEAVASYRTALSLVPDFPEACNNLGNALHCLGRSEEAVVVCRRAVQIQPNYTDAWNNLGICLQASGHLEEAMKCYQTALSQRPNFPEAYNNISAALQGLGRHAEAINCLQTAMQLRPNFPEVHNNLGNALQTLGHLDQAIASFRHALTLRADFPDALSNLGNALQAQGQFEEAERVCRRALELRPNYGEALNNLGISLHGLDRFEESKEALRKSIAIRPQAPEAYSNLGVAYQSCGELADAIHWYRKAIAVRESYAEAHFNLALLLLMTSEFEDGWREYEWRWRVPGFPSPTRNFKQPQWDGSPAPQGGGTLLLHTEQGLGDAIQFARYIPLIRNRGWNVVLECQAPLVRLMEDAENLSVRAIPRALTAGAPEVAFDTHIPAASLPLVLHELDPRTPTLPTEPYLRARPELREVWRQRIEAAGPGLRVGLAWAGSPTHKNDRNRSVPLSIFAPLARPDVKFFSLQLGNGADQAKNPPPGMDLIDLTAHITDMADTAAFVSELDLIISVDTALVHLTGALGRPTWVMIPFIPDFRWLMDRDDTPLYPSLRLFRQARAKIWDDVIVRLSEALDRERAAMPAPVNA